MIGAMVSASELWAVAPHASRASPLAWDLWSPCCTFPEDRHIELGVFSPVVQFFGESYDRTIRTPEAMNWQPYYFPSLHSADSLIQMRCDLLPAIQNLHTLHG
jgi:hypothetical protein